MGSRRRQNVRERRGSVRALLVAGAAWALAMLAVLAATSTRPGEALAQAPPVACPAPSEPLTFTPQTYIDTKRAGGEPTVETHPDGTLLYGSHAGTTHFYTPGVADEDTAAFPENYRNQIYLYWSRDDGKTWHYVPRDPPNGTPGSGFSDPDFAIDLAGNVYASEINLVNVAVSRSTDSGHKYTLQNFAGLTVHDRQWMESDEKNVLYIVGNSFGGGTSPNQPVGNFGHYLYRSTDGGETFAPGVLDDGGLGDVQVDKSDGTLYEAYYEDSDGDGSLDVLSMTVRDRARNGNLDATTHQIAAGVDMLSHWPSFDLDPAGNLYITWDESGDGDRPAGIWFSYSTDHGVTWAAPTRVDTDDRTDIWPWLAVGDEGRVAVAWLEADVALPQHNAETPGAYGWRVIAAQTLSGHGCETSPTPAFLTAVATPEPVHTGTICQGGTACQAMAVDRRLGDYFQVEIDDLGAMYAGYSDTRRGGAVALPGFVHQSGGPSFLASPPAPCSNRIEGTKGADRLKGGTAPDRIVGRGGPDRLDGGDGDDCVSGKSGGDRVAGGSGNDSVRGGRGKDRLRGGGGADVIRTGRRGDRVKAGGGDDVVRTARGARDRVDCGSGKDKAFINGRFDRAKRNCENVKAR